MMSKIKVIGRRCQIPLLWFQKIVGKLRHESIGIPSVKGLSIPIHDTMREATNTTFMIKTLRHAFRDLRILLRIATRNLTHVK